MIVNRLWQELFGTGIVRSSEDFGIMGEAPSHPELLDWLAVEFRSDWDYQRMLKLIVTSATYRQSAVGTAAQRERDPANRLLSHGPRFRMDAEVLRDYALSVSGLLVPTVGGASVKPYQPEGVWEAVGMRESNTKLYRPDRGPALYRRSMYSFWKRMAPPASMDILNAPEPRDSSCVRRERTNTPLQALVTLERSAVHRSRACAWRSNALESVSRGAMRSGQDSTSSSGCSAAPADGSRNRLVRPAGHPHADLLAHVRGATLDDAEALALAVGEIKADANPSSPPVELASDGRWFATRC